MKIVFVVAAAALIAAVPISMTSNSDGETNNEVIAALTKECPKESCFGSHVPSAEHQQCMVAAPSYELDQRKRAYQSGCWCIESTKSCKAYCSGYTPQEIRVLAVNPDSGANEWVVSSVSDEVKFTAAVNQTEINFRDADLVMDCVSGCQSRGLCEK